MSIFWTKLKTNENYRNVILFTLLWHIESKIDFSWRKNQKLLIKTIEMNFEYSNVRYTMLWLSDNNSAISLSRFLFVWNTKYRQNMKLHKTMKNSTSFQAFEYVCVNVLLL